MCSFMLGRALCERVQEPDNTVISGQVMGFACARPPRLSVTIVALSHVLNYPSCLLTLQRPIDRHVSQEQELDKATSCVFQVSVRSALSSRPVTSHPVQSRRRNLTGTHTVLSRQLSEVTAFSPKRSKALRHVADCAAAP